VNSTAEIVIVGGGVAGCAAAIAPRAGGRSVVMLDRTSTSTLASADLPPRSRVLLERRMAGLGLDGHLPSSDRSRVGQ
jgi:2-polyprenyl-6-methoxyphenol hydroxylase-like FAD-dependent oxidoreductase